MAEQNSRDEEVFTNLQAINVKNKDVNILLLGSTGIGKSTFINSFANYLEYDSFDIAEQNKVRCLIPAKFIVTDDKFENKTVQIGSDDNENATMAASATLATRSYVFPLNRHGINRIRLIDTPGIGDTRGIEQDNENMENILEYISNLEELHAICFLLIPNNARLTVMFHYCIKQLLSRLEKSASGNIIFLFTNTRGTFYKPGDTTTALKTILNKIKDNPPHVEIKYKKDNVFCLDNEAFRYLVAVKNGIYLGNKADYSQSWKHSVDECWRMIHFITGQGNSETKVVPHKVRSTLSVNEARKVILQLSKPLADIADLINDNILALERHNKVLKTENQSIEELKENLYVPVVNLRFKEVTEPITVCTAAKCSEIYTVGNLTKYHYKERCHDPCCLQNVPRELVGSPELVNCCAMLDKKCRFCTCDFSVHMHIYYITETFDDKIDNEGVKAQITDKETALERTKEMIAEIQARKLEYEEEKEVIIKTMAKFAHFLQHNAISSYNDAYKEYIKYLIDREKSNGPTCNFENVKHFEELIKRYDEEKSVLDDALTSTSGIQSRVTAKSVFDTIETLYSLRYTGQQIRNLHDRHTKSQAKQHQKTEIVLDPVRSGRPVQDRNKKKQKDKRQQGHKQQSNERQFDPSFMNTHGYGSGQYQNQFYPHGPQGPFPYQQYQGFPGPYPHNYGGYPGNFPNQNYSRGQPVFQNNRYSGNQNHQGQQNYVPPNVTPQSGFQTQQQRFDQNNDTRTGDAFDIKFEDWLTSIMSNDNDSTNVPVNQGRASPEYNSPRRRVTFAEETRWSSSSNGETERSAEDTEFKEFMKKHGLNSYLNPN